MPRPCLPLSSASSYDCAAVAAEARAFADRAAAVWARLHTHDARVGDAFCLYLAQPLLDPLDLGQLVAHPVPRPNTMDGPARPFQHALAQAVPIACCRR